MKQKRYSEEQIVYALRQAESGEKVVDICHQMGISEQTFYAWRKKYAGMDVSELRELRQLREENRKLKQLVADLTLDKHMLQEVLAKKAEARTQARAGAVSAAGVCDQRAASVWAGFGLAVELPLCA